VLEYSNTVVQVGHAFVRFGGRAAFLHASVQYFRPRPLNSVPHSGQAVRTLRTDIHLPWQLREQKRSICPARFFFSSSARISRKLPAHCEQATVSQVEARAS
jgi:hypothetical protein